MRTFIYLHACYVFFIKYYLHYNILYYINSFDKMDKAKIYQ